MITFCIIRRFSRFDPHQKCLSPAERAAPIIAGIPTTTAQPGAPQMFSFLSFCMLYCKHSPPYCDLKEREEREERRLIKMHMLSHSFPALMFGGRRRNVFRKQCLSDCSLFTTVSQHLQLARRIVLFLLNVQKLYGIIDDTDIEDIRS